MPASIKIVKNTVKAAPIIAKLRAAVGVYANTAAKKMEADAKNSAKWTDRTGNARNSIIGDSSWVGYTCRIRLSGNVSYFVYLELAMQKRWAILVPTMEANAPSIVSGIGKLL